MASLKNTVINDTGYLKLPNGTSAQRPASPSNGMFRYNTDLGSYEYYSSNRWITPGVPYQYYTEGMSANSYTGNWNNSSTYYMAQYANLGGGYAHGGVTGPVTFLLTLNGLPSHSQIRYVVKWHMVDSLDNETSSLYCSNASGGETNFFTWTKQYNSAPSYSVIASGASQSWLGGQAYSYRPWGNGNYGQDGYATLDTGYYAHTASSFVARNNMGYDQVITDEAMYLTSVEVWLVS